MSDPLLDGLDFIYKNLVERGSDEHGMFSISAYEFMWLDSIFRQMRRDASLSNTVLSYVALLYGEEIQIPKYLIPDGIGQHTINVTKSFLPIESGEDQGDWKIKIIVKDVSDEGEFIED